MMTENPYEAPSTAPQEENLAVPNIQLASRWARLGAAILDSIIMIVLMFPLLILIFFLGAIPGTNNSNSYLDNILAMSDSIIADLITSLAGIGIYLAVNGYLMIKSGQTIGKKVLNIQVVDYRTQQLLPAGRIMGMRYLLPSLINSVPIVGGLFTLVDHCFIFGAEKRCIHDHMAGSSVINKIH